MRHLGLAIVTLGCLSALAAVPEAETADDLPVTEGLELWLDASRLSDAAGGEANPAPRQPQRVDRWPDASGNRRHAVQPHAAHQPQRVAIMNPNADPPTVAGWVVRFDGEDDHLRILDANRRYANFTLFMVAAPHANPGGFRGFLAFNQRDRRDYESGFTLDMNYPASARLQDLNLEGRGFGGARNLLTASVSFDSLHIIEAVADAQRRQVRLTFDGQEGGMRDFAPAELVADEFTIGARFYENSSARQRVQGFLPGDIAELILFNRVLSAAEQAEVRAYLDRKHAQLREALPRSIELADEAADVERLVVVAEPPPVQMLVPGFSVRALPVELTNINNLRYRPDGKLYALGYNGDVWLLRDTDGDELEDRAERFFDNRGRLRGPIGMAVIPPGHALLDTPVAQGLIVAAKGKVSALLDRDGDDVAEVERVIATGWEEIVQNVDALGIAVHPGDGAIYFGLGTAAYNNAYLLNEEGSSSFDLGSERGTIQRIAPDLSRRETVCTGVRFTVGMAFNADRELFVTDQEGATWLPNGNPFDELLHIRPERHYGFPPRHPVHLPRVFDEPSLFDYGPQHQSTCGLVFNVGAERTSGEPGSAPAGPIFGPEHWRNDALVCGESRGKLYRTQLVRGPAGDYVARNHLIGCLSMLTVDCCVSPRGDLLVACHSGGPDWGTGPSGIGKLFRIRYAERQLPQPLFAWAAAPQEVRIAFDRPLEPQQLTQVVSQTKITYGPYVAAGDRFESIRPGYAVTQMQQSAPRRRLAVYSASVTPDRRTLILTTAPQSAAVHYAVTLPGLGRGSSAVDPGDQHQHPQVDLAYSLAGVWATWTPEDSGRPGWSGWLPHWDESVVQGLSLGEASQRQYEGLLAQPGQLTLSTQLDFRGLYAPALQPGSQLDYDVAADTFTQRRSFRLHAARPFTLTVGDGAATAAERVDSGYEAIVAVEADNEPVPVKWSISTGGGTPRLQSSWQVALQDGQLRSGSLALHRFLLPWAAVNADPAKEITREIEELARASWGRGRRVFFSEEAGCGKCHTSQPNDPRQAAGKSTIGPDLSNLIHRDYESVLRDITFPSYAINPDYITYTTTLVDGRILTGSVRSDGERLWIGDREGRVTSVLQEEVETSTPAAISIMPEGLPQKLGPQRMKDLLAYLLLPAPRMPRDALLAPPPPRTRKEVADVLAGGQEATPSARSESDVRPLSILLVAGAKDHGPGEHDYPAWLHAWGELLAAAPGVTLSTAMEWPTASQIEAADTIVFFQKGSWNTQRAQALDAHLAKGRGLVYIHWAVEGGSEAPAFAQRIGLASDASRLKFRHGPLELGFETGRDHPIGRNFEQVKFYDESYWQMQGDAARIRVLGTSSEEGRPQPVFWTFEPGRGRVFVSIPGHYSWTFDDPLFRVLLLRGIAWSAREPVDRLNELATLGVDWQEERDGSD